MHVFFSARKQFFFQHQLTAFILLGLLHCYQPTLLCHAQGPALPSSSIPPVPIEAQPRDRAVSIDPHAYLPIQISPSLIANATPRTIALAIQSPDAEELQSIAGSNLWQRPKDFDPQLVENARKKIKHGLRLIREMQIWWVIHSSQNETQERSPSDLLHHPVQELASSRQPLDQSLDSTPQQRSDPLGNSSLTGSDKLTHVIIERFVKLILPIATSSPSSARSNPIHSSESSTRYTKKLATASRSDQALVGSACVVFTLEEPYLAYDLTEKDRAPAVATLLEPIATNAPQLERPQEPIHFVDTRDSEKVWEEFDSLLELRDTVEPRPRENADQPLDRSDLIVHQPSVFPSLADLPILNPPRKPDPQRTPKRQANLETNGGVTMSPQRTIQPFFVGQLGRALATFTTISAFADDQITKEFVEQLKAINHFLSQSDKADEEKNKNVAVTPSATGVALLMRAGVDLQPPIVDKGSAAPIDHPLVTTDSPQVPRSHSRATGAMIR